MDTPMLDDLAHAAAEAPPQPELPVSAIPMVAPMQWEMGRLQAQDGTTWLAVTFHQPNSKTHVVMGNDDARKFAETILEQTSGLTIAHAL